MRWRKGSRNGIENSLFTEVGFGIAGGVADPFAGSGWLRKGGAEGFVEVVIVDLVADFAGEGEDVWRHCRSSDR